MKAQLTPITKADHSIKRQVYEEKQFNQYNEKLRREGIAPLSFWEWQNN